MTSENKTRRSDQVDDEINAVCATVDSAGQLTPASSGCDATAWDPECLPSGSAVVVIKRGPDAGSRFKMDRVSLSAGRDPASDIFLDDITVSRHHAEFRCENGRSLIIDLGSLNGTYVNRQPVDSAPLATGDEIQLGNFRLVFFDDLAPAGSNNEIRIQ